MTKSSGHLTILPQVEIISFDPFNCGTLRIHSFWTPETSTRLGKVEGHPLFPIQPSDISFLLFLSSFLFNNTKNQNKNEEGGGVLKRKCFFFHSFYLPSFERVWGEKEKFLRKILKDLEEKKGKKN